VSRRRRIALLLGLATILGTLAASDVGRREQRLRELVGPAVPVVVARSALRAGEPIEPGALAVRHVPRRYAPRERIGDVREAVGLRARLDVPEGGDLAPAALDDGAGPRLAPGERIADLVATGDPRLVRPGGRVDVLVTRGQDREGSTRLALEDAEVVQVRPAPEGETGEGTGGRIAVSLRVDVRQAVYLAAAQNFASELRVLPRGPGDDRRGGAGLAATASLEGVR